MKIDAPDMRDRSPGFCSKCRDKHCEGTCLLSSTFLFFLCSFTVFSGLGLLFAWLTFSPYRYQRLAAVAGAGCQPDDEGSWSIGVFKGPAPFELQPLEKLNSYNDRAAAWPVANPVLTCASASDGGHASNFVADPFLYIRGSSLYIFFETKNAITMQGDIGVAESSDNGVTWRYLGVALDEEWHLSYPFVFDYDGEIYMMPEGSEHGDLRLYRAVEFPLKWSFHKTMIRRPLVDATLLKHDQFYWIFASDFKRFGSRKNGELEIWYSTSPLGAWKQHRGNPVHNGDRSLGARNGGRPFVHEGQLYRPGQDCGGTYGSKIRIFRVETLTRLRFREVEVSLGFEESKKARNAWNGVRYHHLDAQKLPSGQWVAVMDGDRVPSGDVSFRFYLGCFALVVLILLNGIVGYLFGFFRLPSFRHFCSGKRGDVPQFVARLHRAALRLNREMLPVRNKIRSGSRCLRTCLMVLIFVLSTVAVCAAVRCFFGGSGAAEPYPVKGVYSQFTMVAMTYEARLWNLKMYVQHYSRCPSVREIVVVWNKGQVPELDEFDSAVPVRIRIEHANSLNNRFRPDSDIKTRAVFQLDDDIMMTCDDVERAFRTWRETPDRLVGFYPRLVDGDPLEYRNERHARDGNGYNVILTGAAFMDRSVFDKYWSRDMAAARGIVDEMFNCEDILMNFMLANGTSGRAVEYVHPSWAVDMSRFSGVGISKDTQSHYDKRSMCLARFASLYGGVPMRKWEFNRRKDGWDH